MEDRRTSRPAERAQRTLERGLEPRCFQRPPIPSTQRTPKPKPRTGDYLHVCPSCDSRLVYPLTWKPAGRNSWEVSLRCPECEWRGGGTYRQAVLERFDEVLDGGTEEVIEDLKVLALANLEEDIERFVRALGDDHILPEDF